MYHLAENRISRTVLAANRINRIVWTSAYGCISRAVGRSQYLVVRTFKGLHLSYRGDRVVLEGIITYMYSVFGCPGTLLLIIIIIVIIIIIIIFIIIIFYKHSFLYGRNEPLVRYCFLWLLCGRGERFVQYCFLWRSCADAGCHVYVPWVYHLAAKQGCTDVCVWLPKLGGLNIFCAHVLRGYLWASPIFFIFFFVSTLVIELALHH